MHKKSRPGYQWISQAFQNSRKKDEPPTCATHTSVALLLGCCAGARASQHQTLRGLPYACLLRFLRGVQYLVAVALYGPWCTGDGDDRLLRQDLTSQQQWHAASTKPRHSVSRSTQQPGNKMTALEISHALRVIPWHRACSGQERAENWGAAGRRKEAEPIYEMAQAALCGGTTHRTSNASQSHATEIQ